MRYLPSPDAVRDMSTDELRAHFLVTDLFQPERLTLRLFDLDRVVLGGAVPAGRPLALEAPPELAAAYFCERRELGVLNIGGPGRVHVDGSSHALRARDALYVGRGSREVRFESEAADAPARFYLVSYPAHAAHPAEHVTAKAADAAELGSAEQANRRRLARYFHPGALPTAQLVMGVTELRPGSVWNTMPCHTHPRRSEVYLYFDLPADAVVVHLMGEPRQTRSLVVRNEQVVLSPGWSVHCGCGTQAYRFCWAMGGENQEFADMQAVAMAELR